MSLTVYKGFVLWLIHTRSRFGDAARLVEEPWLDLDAGGDGYVESAAKFGAYKTGH